MNKNTKGKVKKPDKKEKVDGKPSGFPEKEDKEIITICKKLGNFCKSDRERIKERRRVVFTRLGAQIWSLYQEKVNDTVFENERVKPILDELKRCEQGQYRITAEKAARRKKDEQRNMLKNAVSNLKSKDSRIRMASLRIINKIGDEKTIPCLSNVLKDPDASVRRFAAGVMHKLVNSEERRDRKQEKGVKKKNCEKKIAGKL